MKTIEIITGNQKAQFTTKSVTFDGKEFFYSLMSQVQHNEGSHEYTFVYDGEKKVLPYLEKDAKILAAIFSQIQKIETDKVPQPAEDKAPDEDKVTDKDEVTSEDRNEAVAESPTEEVPETVAEAPVAEPKEEKPKKSIKGLFAKKSTKKADSDASPEIAEEELPVDPEKQAKLKKSLKVFGIIIAAVIAVSLIYFFIFGTTTAPKDVNSNITESQQYDDIDELIEDLQ